MPRRSNFAFLWQNYEKSRAEQKNFRNFVGENNKKLKL